MQAVSIRMAKTVEPTILRSATSIALIPDFPPAAETTKGRGRTRPFVVYRTLRQDDPLSDGW